MSQLFTFPKYRTEINYATITRVRMSAVTLVGTRWHSILLA